MSIVGIFTQSRPEIEGIYFDAILEESSELPTEVTDFPIEDGSIGNDHAALRPLRLTMTVGISDNPYRALRAAASDSGIPGAGALAGIGAGAGVGAVSGALSGPLAAAAGLGASVANAAFAAGQSASRSQSALDNLRDIQRSCRLITVVTAKGKTYENCLITNTRQTTDKQNEQGLELVIEMKQMMIINSTIQRREILPPEDTSSTQAQREVDLGEASPT